MKKLAILGASGHGKVVADLAELLGYEVSFFDDAWPERSANGTWPVVGSGADLLPQAASFAAAVVAIGNNRVRLEKMEALRAAGFALPALVHPQAVLSAYAQVGEGSVVFAGAVVNADARIGRGVILNTSCSVDHDCVLEDGVHISPGAHLAGAVKVGACAWVGIGSAVRQLVRIGADVQVGAGAAVVKDLPDAVLVVGVPAREVK